MAAKSALNQVGMHIIGHAMKNCLIDEEEKDPDALIDEAIAVFLKYSSCIK
jgi:DNA-binding FrmR family transcriptional regulator